MSYIFNEPDLKTIYDRLLLHNTAEKHYFTAIDNGTTALLNPYFNNNVKAVEIEQIIVKLTLPPESYNFILTVYGNDAPIIIYPLLINYSISETKTFYFNINTFNDKTSSFLNNLFFNFKFNKIYCPPNLPIFVCLSQNEFEMPYISEDVYMGVKYKSIHEI